MRTFFEFRKLLKAEVRNVSQVEKYFPQNFHESQNRAESHGQLQEESWLSKGYAIGQGLRHSSTKQQIASILSTVSSICDRGKNERDVAEKLDILFDALQQLTRVYRGLTELSNNTINVGIAGTLLSEDFQKLLATELGKIQKRA